MKSKLGLFSNGSISSSLFLMETNLIRFLFFIFFSWNTCSVSLFVWDGILNILHCIHAKRCHRSLFFLYIMHSLYNMLLLFILPIFWHLQYHNDVGKMLSCSQSGLISLHLKTSKDDSYSLRCSSWSQSSLSCVFFHRFLRVGEAPSHDTTVLTVWHTPGVTPVFQVCYRKWVKLECFLKLSYGDNLLPASFRKQTKVLSALTRTHYSSYWSYPSFNCTGDMAFICTQRIILYIHIYIIDITIPVSDNACYYTCIFNVYCL